MIESVRDNNDELEGTMRVTVEDKETLKMLANPEAIVEVGDEATDFIISFEYEGKVFEIVINVMTEVK